MKNLAILGSTGSIGTQALDIVVQNPHAFKVVALTANKNIELLLQQIKTFQPETVAVFDEQKAAELQAQLAQIPRLSHLKVHSGLQGLILAATHPAATIVLTALVGAVGIEPTYQAILAGKDIALANKETLVADGERIIAAAHEKNTNILPVDSEHSAIFQCLRGRSTQDIEKIILTCSGGPFLGQTRAELQNITPAQALKHPTWDMGAKISIDSATLANKGLEVIEAHYLFGLPYEKIEVVIHPQSLIHSMVQFTDGNIICQVSQNDMRIPIAYALNYPHTVSNDLPRLNIPCVNPLKPAAPQPAIQPSADSFARTHRSLKSSLTTTTTPPLTSLTFAEPDYETFPALKLAYLAGQRGGPAPATFNAANEEAVQLFLSGQISFLQIAEHIKKALQECEGCQASDAEKKQAAQKIPTI